MGGSSSSYYIREEHHKKNIIQEGGFNRVKVPAGLSFIKIEDCIPCQDGHHALRHDNNSIKIWGNNDKEVYELQLVFCQCCLIQMKLSNICNSFCNNISCSKRFYCFRGCNHEGSHMCYDCPTKFGFTNSGHMTISERSQSNRAFLQQSNQFIQAISENPFAPINTLSSIFPQTHLAIPEEPQGLVYTISSNFGYQQAEHNETHIYECSGGSKSGFFSKKSYSSTSNTSYSSDNASLTRCQRSRMATKNNEGLFHEHKLIQQHQQPTNNKQAIITKNYSSIVDELSPDGTIKSSLMIHDTDTPIQETSIFFTQQHTCLPGQHQGKVFTDAFHKEILSKHSSFYDSQLQQQIFHRIGSNSSIVTCINQNCGLSTCFAANMNIQCWEINSILKQLQGNTKFDYSIGSISNNNDTNKNNNNNIDLSNFINHIIDFTELTPGILFSNDQLQRYFPNYSYSTHCKYGKHVFNHLFISAFSFNQYSTTIKSMIQEYCHQSSSSTSFACFQILQNIQINQCFTKQTMNALIIQGEIFCGQLRCIHCNTVTKDPAETLHLLFQHNPQQLSLHGMNFTSKDSCTEMIKNITLEYAFEQSFGSCSTPSRPTNNPQEKLPVLYEWMSTLDILHWQENYFKPFNENGFTLYWMVHNMNTRKANELLRPYFDINQIDTAEEDWIIFIQQLNFLKSYDQQIEL